MMESQTEYNIDHHHLEFEEKISIDNPQSKEIVSDSNTDNFPILTGVIAGAFDIIHPGYVKMFKFMKEYCNVLIVLLHSDPSYERETKLKPILSVTERMEILLALKYVDKVEIYDREKDLVRLLEEIKPDMRFLGDDYLTKPFTGDHLDIPIVFVDRTHGWSTTDFKRKIYYQIKESLG